MGNVGNARWGRLGVHAPGTFSPKNAFVCANAVPLMDGPCCFVNAGVPGPSAYQPCDGCCVACDTYKGKSFGLRPTSMYGKVGGRRILQLYLGLR